MRKLVVTSSVLGLMTLTAGCGGVDELGIVDDSGTPADAPGTGSTHPRDAGKDARTGADAKAHGDAGKGSDASIDAAPDVEDAGHGDASDARLDAPVAIDTGVDAPKTVDAHPDVSAPVCTAATCGPNATCAVANAAAVCTCDAGFAGVAPSCAPGTAPGLISINAESTTTSTAAVTLYLQEPRNLIQNPNASTGNLNDWTVILAGGNGWAATPGDPAFHLFGPNMFITSYGLDTRSQVVDLTTLGYTQAELDAAPPIAVREWSHGGGYTLSDSYYLKVELRDGTNKVLASLNDNATTSTTGAAWAVTSKTFTGYGTGARYVYVEDGGHDAENWLGQYGAAMSGASVVLGANQMRLSNDDATWSAWQPFAPTVSWTLSSGNGTKTVYVELMDSTGYVWPAISATITLL
jgi:hypothetical protein